MGGITVFLFRVWRPSGARATGAPRRRATARSGWMTPMFPTSAPRISCSASRRRTRGPTAARGLLDPCDLDYSPFEGESANQGRSPSARRWGEAWAGSGSAGFPPAKRKPAGKMPALPGRRRYSQTPSESRPRTLSLPLRAFLMGIIRQGLYRFADSPSRGE